MEHRNEKKVINNGTKQDYKNRRKKPWKIKYKFFMDIIKSDSPLFKENNLSLTIRKVEDLRKKPSLKDLACHSNKNSFGTKQKSVKNQENFVKLNEDFIKLDQKIGMSERNPLNLDLNETDKQILNNQMNIVGLNYSVITKNEYFKEPNSEEKESCKDLLSNNDSHCTNVSDDSFSQLNLLENSLNKFNERSISIHKNVISNGSLNEQKKNAEKEETIQFVDGTEEGNCCSENKTKLKFMKPLLPVNKRPPTRRSFNNDCVPSKRSLEDFSKELPKDSLPCSIDIVKNKTISNDLDLDVISLCASSNFNNLIESKLNPEIRPLIDDGELLMKKQTSVARWITGEQTSILSEICNKYLKGRCSFGFHCKNSHKLPNDIDFKVAKMSIKELKMFVEHIKTNADFLCQTIPTVIQRAQHLMETNYVIELIGVVLEVKLIDKTPYVNTILNSLQTDVKPLEMVVQEVLLVYGRQNHVLCDILLSIVTSRREPLSDNWATISTLVRHRKDLDFGVVSDMLRKCAEEPSNVILMRNICKDVLSCNVALDKIDRTVLDDFVSQLQMFNMYELAEQIVHKRDLLRRSNYNLTSACSPVDLLQDFRIPILEEPKNQDLTLEKAIKFNDSSILQSLVLQTKNNEENVLIVLSNVRQELCAKYRFHDVAELDRLALNTIVRLTESDHYVKAYELLLLYKGTETELIKKKTCSSNIYNDYFVKYILLIKIFTRNYLYSRASQLLLAKDWNNCCRGEHVINKRRFTKFVEVCTELFEKVVTTNYQIAKEILSHFIEKNIFIIDLDIWNHFNQLLRNLLEKVDNREQLWTLLRIVKLNYMKIDKGILRMTFTLLYDNLNVTQRMEFFNNCIRVGLYATFNGFESLIELPKNLTLNETHMMLSTYLECRKRSYFKQVRVTIKIGDPMINSDTFLDVFNNEIYLKDIYDIITKKFHITKGITILNEKNLTIEFI